MSAVRKALECLPCWGPHPESNRWSEIEYVATDGGYHLHDGEIMRDGVRLGLITVIHRPGKGPDIGDGLVCDWRYQAAAVEAAAREGA